MDRTTPDWRSLTTRRRDLPHWEAEGATYFVTFRLADSLPAAALNRYLAAKAEIHGALGREPAESSRRTASAFIRLLDSALDKGVGSCLLSEPGAARIVQDALRHYHGERYDLESWCVMPNHVHVLARIPLSSGLQEVLHTWKSFTAHQINRFLGRKGRLWQDESFDHIVRSDREWIRVAEYIETNPVRAGLKDWEWVGTMFPS